MEALKELTAGRGPDACIDAVGMEAHTSSPLYAYDRGEIDQSFVVSHQLPLDEARRGYEVFLNKREQCMKVVLKP